jgi:hypothetical protein
MRCLAQVMACLVPLMMAHQVRAQPGSGGLGQRMITGSGTPLKIGRLVVDDGKRDAPSVSRGLWVYRVERVQGPWLWLVPEQEGKSGWVKAGQVVPYDKAIEYFTSEIRAHPNGFSLTFDTAGEFPQAADRPEPRQDDSALRRGIGVS